MCDYVLHKCNTIFLDQTILRIHIRKHTSENHHLQINNAFRLPIDLTLLKSIMHFSHSKKNLSWLLSPMTEAKLKVHNF